MTVNVIDLIALFVVLFTVWMGWRSGFVIQALALAGFVAGVALLIGVAPHAAPLLEDLEGPTRSLLVLFVMVSVVLLAQGLGSSIGAALRRRMGYGVISGVDHAAGGLFGVARGVFMVWLLAGLLAVVPVPALATEARTSLALRAIETHLPSPVGLAAEFGRIIEQAGLPDVFAGLPPPPSEPIEGPGQEAAERIAAPGRQSTLRVEAIACGRFMTGTGWAVDPSYLVTNAHVVAGADRIWLSFDGALDRHAATLVHYDPDLDVALLHAPRLVLEPLVLADAAPGRGTNAAAIGFTGGGRQRAIPAVVSRTLEALGRDIYGRRTVTRRVVEMRADVAPGDSGGPVLLEDGSVGGVTFSESREDRSIGYALSPVAVSASISGSIGATGSVSAGECLPGI